MTSKLDQKSTLIKHRAIIRNNQFLHKLYQSFYRKIAALLPKTKGQIIEFGSGGGFIKETIPNCITSDLISQPWIDQVINAENINVNNNSVSAFILLDTFHHLKNPERSLREMERCLVPHGKIIMIEPFGTLWGKFIYTNFHQEKYDPEASTWRVAGKGRLSDANVAMPWIVFFRDRIIFEKKFPSLKIKRLIPHTPFSYLLSGGLSYPQFLPAMFFPLIEFIENVLKPLNGYLGMFITIEIEKE